jgi:hypothetical protein
VRKGSAGYEGNGKKGGGGKVAGSLGEPWKIRIRTIVLVYGSKRSGSILQGPGYGTMLPANNFIHDAGNIPL